MNQMLAGPESHLKREIGRIGVATIAMNGVIGSGIFALPAVAIEQAGAFSPWLFLLCGILILTVALTLARNASFFETTGGPIVYTTAAFGRFIGFQTGLLIYVSRVAAIAASANLLVSYAVPLWSPLASGTPRTIAVVSYIVIATVLNAVGVRAGMAVLYLISILKLFPLLLLVLVGVPEIEWATIAGAKIAASETVGSTMLVLMYAFIGFEFSLINAGETRDARSAIPRTLVKTVLAVAIVYALIQLVAVSIGPDLGNSETPLVELAQRLMGPAGALLLSVGVVFSIGGGSLTSLLTAPRLTYALSRDGTLPGWFGAVNERTHVPVNSILFCGALSIALAVSQQFIWLATLSTIIRLLTYALCIAALPVIERKLPTEAGQFRIPGGLVIPGIALVLTVWLLTHSTLQSVLITGAVVAVGSIVFGFCTNWKRDTVGTASAD
ncbi:APC family permease [Novosphingobium sp. APW14]|jgi:amino acid transporter|uniref:APC family permease n=1 Tax=Novosphingobium sp. APW14 TaxID=3077237 RepID=UPI0028DEF1DE|nr:APC family permease [Novosphingobium sp. APW14]MDT9014102.1 APC family permease [Novosphingobium sp. APW14]